MTAAMALIRWAHLLPLLAIFGTASFGEMLHAKGLLADRLTLPWLPWAALLAFLAALAQLLFTSIQMADSWNGVEDPSAIATVVGHTLFGQVFILRIVALALLALAVLRGSPSLLVAVLSGIALAGVALTSHAAASGQQSFMLFRAANDAVHLLTAGFWIGGLAVLLQLAQRHKAVLLAGPVNLFSEVAIYAVTALTLAGMLNTGFVWSAQRVTWAYALLLAAKVILATAMIALAFINRLRVAPALEAGSGSAAFARNVGVELALGVGVVALAAVLGSIAPQ